MAHPLHDSRLKLIRAETHLEAFKAEITAYQRREPHTIVGDFELERPDGQHYVFRARIFEEPDPRWGLIAGDFTHNIRSALDYLAWQLVILAGNTPTKRTQFPIFSLPDHFTKRSGPMTEGMRPDHVTLLESLQPYHASRLEVAPLAVLNTLSNRDKHRVLSAPLSTISAVGWDVISQDPGLFVFMDNSTTDLWQVVVDNAEIAKVPIHLTPGTEPKAYTQSTLHLNVSLGAGEEAVHTLTQVYEEAKRIVIDVFAPEFGTAIRKDVSLPP